jgi:hypothetical protein
VPSQYGYYVYNRIEQRSKVLFVFYGSVVWGEGVYNLFKGRQGKVMHVPMQMLASLFLTSFMCLQLL